MPEMMDIFNNDAFRVQTMTAAVNSTPYAPDYLGSLGIFTPTPIRTIDAAVVINDDGLLEVVQTSQRGEAPYEQKISPAMIRSFRTPRVAIGDTVNAHELQGIVARSMLMGGDIGTILADVQSEISYRLDGPTGLRAKQEATKERMRLGAISGIVLDKDGSTLYNWPTLFNVALPTEIAFDLDAAAPATGVLSTLIRGMKRDLARAARVGNRPFRVYGFAGDEFFDKLIKHADVLPSWNAFQGGTSTRIAFGVNTGIEPFTEFQWEGITWVNYRGTDDNTTIAIATDKVKFVPAGIPGLFQEVLAPYEGFGAANSPGLPLYTLMIWDRDRDQWARVETYSYPMYMATRPGVLFSGRAGA
jgi:hypothetical protein